MPSNRTCGDCQLCCTLLPVQEGMKVTARETGESKTIAIFDKKAGQRCVHQRTGHGCMLHGTQMKPNACNLWNCRWLSADDTADLARPDRSRYVIDVIPDFVEITDNATKEVLRLPAIQIWVDPSHPHAHRDEALRRYLERRGEEGYAAIIRYNSQEGLVLFPPAITGDGFVENASGFSVSVTDKEKVEILEGLGVEIKP